MAKLQLTAAQRQQHELCRTLGSLPRKDDRIGLSASDIESAFMTVVKDLPVAKLKIAVELLISREQRPTPGELRAFILELVANDPTAMLLANPDSAADQYWIEARKKSGEWARTAAAAFGHFCRDRDGNRVCHSLIGVERQAFKMVAVLGDGTISYGSWLSWDGEQVRKGIIDHQSVKPPSAEELEHLKREVARAQPERML